MSDTVIRDDFLRLAVLGSVIVLALCLYSTGPSNWNLPALGVFLPVSAVPYLLWHERKQTAKRDAAVTIPLALILAAIMPGASQIGIRERMPLRDHAFHRLDMVMGLDVQRISAWFSTYHLSRPLAISYESIPLFVLCATLFPALAGKRDQARKFVLAHIIAFLVAVPVFVLCPGIGPWVGYGFRPDHAQMAVEQGILAVRSSGVGFASASVCLPSFHVLLAILSAEVLGSSFPWCRVPAAVFATLTVISTVTTGWHYSSDSVAGIVLAVSSLALARVVLKQGGHRPQADSFCPA